MSATEQNEELPPLPAPSIRIKTTDYGFQYLAVRTARDRLTNPVYPLWAKQKRVDPATKRVFEPAKLAAHLAALEMVEDLLLWISQHGDEFNALRREIAAREKAA